MTSRRSGARSSRSRPRPLRPGRRSRAGAPTSSARSCRPRAARRASSRAARPSAPSRRARPGSAAPCPSGSASAPRTARRACRSRRGRSRSPPTASRSRPCARRSARRCRSMSRYGFDACSCGSRMLKPTESPPASRAPRFAASITPGPPPVIDRPAALGEAASDRARGLVGGMPSSIRAEPKTATAGRSIRVELLRSPRGTRARSSRPRPSGSRLAVSRSRRSSTATRGGAAACTPRTRRSRAGARCRRRAMPETIAFSRPPPYQSQRVERQTAPPSRIPNGSRLIRLRKKPK